MTIVMLVCLNILAILSRNKTEISDALGFFAIILDIAYSFYLGRLYEFEKLVDVIQKKQ